MSEAGGADAFDRAFRHLENQTPAFDADLLRKVRDPKLRWVRVPLGLAFVAASFFWFLPVVGLEFAPIGLLILAQDIPFLRRPVGRFVLGLDGIYLRLLRRWRHWRRRRRSRL